ncbi:MAG: hypothetical protein HYX66_08900 [Ignavibacteria bacterium]|nr:hypothetical protein [Ignavibacteria bacterium]
MVTSRPLGDAVVEWLLNRTEKYQIQRIIFWRRIWDPKDGWHDYTGENPHTGHVHVEQNWCGAARKNCDTLQAGTSWIQWTLLAMMGGGLVYTWWKRRRYLRAQ